MIKKTFFAALLLSISQAVELNHNIQEPADLTLAQTSADAETETIDGKFKKILKKGNKATLSDIDWMYNEMKEKSESKFSMSTDY